MRQHVASRTDATRTGHSEQPASVPPGAGEPAEKGAARQSGPRRTENVVRLFPDRPTVADLGVLPPPANVLGPIGPGSSLTRRDAADGGSPVHHLPVPRRTPPRRRRRGTIAHAVVAHLAGTARALPPHALTEQVIDAAGYLCADPNRNRRRVVWTEAAATACAYLRLMPPPPPWTLLAVEWPLGDGRADIAWEHPLLGVLVDELKTGKTARRNGVTSGVAQARRYLTALVAGHGDRAVGVRLFVAGNVDASMLLTPGSQEAPLFGSAYCPRLLELAVTP